MSALLKPDSEAYADIPDAMKAVRRWLVWELEPQPGKEKPRKVPYYASGKPRSKGVTLDSPEDMAQFASFDEAIRALNTGRYTGLGFALGPDGTGNYWQGIDLDHISQHPHLAHLADDLPGYTETSPSGDGMHAIGYGRPFTSMKDDVLGIEAYAGGRYFTVTGEGAGIHEPVCIADFVETRLRPLTQRKSNQQQVPRIAPCEVLQPQQIQELREALYFMPADDYKLWTEMGMRLKTLGNTGRGLWMAWSATSTKFDPAEAAEKWETFQPRPAGEEFSTNWRAVFSTAQEHGWVNPMKRFPEIDSAIDLTALLESGKAAPAVVESTPQEELHTPRRIHPFRGPMSDFVQACLKSAYKRQPELAVMAALIGMSSACNGRFRYPDGTRLNLYGLGVAGTGEGKEIPRTLARVIGSKCGSNVIGKPASAAGLEDALENFEGILADIDEFDSLLRAMSLAAGGRGANSHMVQLSSLLLTLFSASDTSHITRLRALSKGVDPHREIHHPALSILGSCTPEELGEAFSTADIFKGLMGRFLMVFGRPDVPLTFDNTELELTPPLIALCDRIRGLGGTGGTQGPSGNLVVNTEITIRIRDQELRQLQDIARDYDRVSKDGNSTFAKQLHQRSFQKAKRIAGVLAVWDCVEQPVIAASHIEWAKDFVDTSNASIMRFCEDFMHGGEQQADAAMLVKLIKRITSGEFTPQKLTQSKVIEHGYVPHSMLLRLSHLDKRRFNDAVGLLLERESIEKQEFKFGQYSTHAYRVAP